MTTWNSADKDAGASLSGGDLVVSGSSVGVRATTSKSSGKNSFAVSGNFSTGDNVVGVSLSGASRVFGDTNGLGILYFSGAGGWITFTNGGVGTADGSSPAPTGSDTIVVHVDSGANKIYFTANGNNLFGGNPAAGTGGITIPSGASFPNASVGGLGGSSSQTADFAPGSLPSGYSAWDGGGGGSPYTLTAAQGSVALSGQAANLVIRPNWTLVGISEASVNASGNYTLTEPSGCQQDDILVVDFAVRSTVIYTNTDWTFPQSDTTGNTTNNTTGSIVSYQTGYCIRGSSAPTLVFSRTGGSRALGTIRAYRSSETGTPSFDTSAEVAMGSAGATVTISGGITTAAANELLVTGVFGARANTVSGMVGATEVTGTSGAIDTTTPPVRGTWTERSDRNNGTSPTVALACYDTIKATAGSTGNLTATESQSARHGMTVMAFKHPTANAYTLIAAQGSVSLSGQTAALRNARKVVAAQGSLSLNGQAASLRRGYTLAANQGSVALSGQTAGLVRTYVLAANQGAVALNGQTARLAISYTLAATFGSLGLAGQSATLRVGRVLQAASGSVSLTGIDADLVYTPASAAYVLTAETGTLNLAGQDATLRAGRKLVAGSATVALTGFDADLVKSAPGAYVLTADTGLISLLGSNANLIYTPVQSVNEATGGGGPSYRGRHKRGKSHKQTVDEAIDRAVDKLERKSNPEAERAIVAVEAVRPIANLPASQEAIDKVLKAINAVANVGRSAADMRSQVARLEATARQLEEIERQEREDEDAAIYLLLVA